MSDPDLHLLSALDVLLAENSVTAAARRLQLSPSAMSRTLTRLRAVTGDPLLVRAGRVLVPTPRAAALREPVQDLVRTARDLLCPETDPLDPATLDRTVVLRTNEAFLSVFAVPLLAAVAVAAPQVRLRFVPKPDRSAHPLRDGLVDLEVGILDGVAPELRALLLFRDRFVGFARAGHPLLQAGAPTLKAYAAARHVAAAPRGDPATSVDAALSALGLRRDIAATVPGFPDAIRIARHTDLLAVVPESCLPSKGEVATFDLPVPVPSFAVAALWHPRQDADPAHRWFRTLLVDLCRDEMSRRWGSVRPS